MTTQSDSIGPWDDIGAPPERVKAEAIGDNVACVIEQAMRPWKQLGERLLAGDEVKVRIDGPSFLNAEVTVWLPLKQ